MFYCKNFFCKCKITKLQNLKILLKNIFNAKSPNAKTITNFFSILLFFFFLSEKSQSNLEISFLEFIIKFGHDVQCFTIVMPKQESIEKLEELLKMDEFKDIFDSEKRVKVPSSQIFKDISIAMGKDLFLSPKYIYTIIKYNRYKIRDNMMLFHDIDFPADLTITKHLMALSKRKLNFK